MVLFSRRNLRVSDAILARRLIISID